MYVCVVTARALRKTLDDVGSALTQLETALPAFFDSPMARGTKHVISVEQATLNASLGFALITIFKAYLATQGQVPDTSDVDDELTRVRDKLVKIVTIRQQQQQQALEHQQSEEAKPIEPLATPAVSAASNATAASNDGEFG